MPDNTLKIGAEVDIATLQAGMDAGAEATRAAIDKMIVSFQEASTGTARAVSKITEDTKAAATSVSAEWQRVAQSTLAYSAAAKEVSAATYLARKAGEGDEAATNLLAAAKQRAAAASSALATAQKAQAEAAAVAAREQVVSAAQAEAAVRSVGVTATASWQRATRASLEYGAALKEVASASDLVARAGAEDAAAVTLLAAAKQKAAAASLELKEAELAANNVRGEGVGILGSFQGAVAGVLGAVISLEFVMHRLAGASDFALGMRNLSAMTGIAADKLAGLHDVVKEVGGNFDAVSIGLSKMTRAQQEAVDGGEKQITAFRRVGVSVAELKTLNPEELFFRLAEGFNKAGSSAEKNAASQALFGRGGRENIAVFQLGAEKLRELVAEASKNSEVTEKNIQAAQRWHSITEQVTVGLRGLALDALPYVMKAGAVAVAGVEGFIAGLMTLYEAMTNAAKTSMDTLVGLGRVVRDVAMGNYGAIVADAMEANSKLVKNQEFSTKLIRQAWQTVGADFKNLWGGMKVPEMPTIKKPGEDLPGEGTGSDDRLSEWQKELQAKRDAEDGFHELSKADEANFWSEKLALARGDAELYAEVYHNMREAERSAVKESLKDEIEQTQERVAAEKAGSAERVAILAEEVGHLKSLGADQTEEFKRLQTELINATRENAEQQAKATIEAERQKVDATRRASDERVGAERAVLDKLAALNLQSTAAYTAQLAKVSQAEREARSEKDKLGELDIDQTKLVAQSSLEVRRQQVQTEFDLHRIGWQQRIALLKSIEDQEYGVEKDALEKKLQLLSKDPTISPVELKRIQNEIENLARTHANKMAQLDTEAAKTSMKNFDQFFNHVTTGFDSTIAGMLRGTTTFGKGMLNMLMDLEISFAQSMARMLLKWIQHHLAKLIVHTTTNQAQVTSDAATEAEGESIGMIGALKSITRAAGKAGAHAFSSVFETVPFPANLILAPVAAAAAFAGTLAFGGGLSSARNGMVSAEEQLAFVHKNEMVLPAPLSLGFQQLLSQGGGGAAAAAPRFAGHGIGTMNVHVHGGGGNADEIADRVMDRVRRSVRTGGVFR